MREVDEGQAALDDTLALWWRGEVRLPEDALLHWLGRNRLLPLMGWRAEAEGWTLPAGMAEAIRAQRVRIAVGQVLADQQLKALGATAQRLGIPVVLVKGAAAAQAYPAPWMRPFGDIDLLVNEQDINGFVEALKSEGYTWTESVEGTRASHLPPLRPQGYGARIEIHHALVWDRGRRSFTLAQWRDRLRPSGYPGLLTPAAVEHVLYLIHHGVIQHEFAFGAQLLTDVWFWTRAWSRDDWEQLAAQCEAVELKRAVGLTLALTMWFWDETGPAEATGLFPVPDARVVLLGQEAVVGMATGKLPGIWRDIPTYNLRGLLAYARILLVGDSAQLHELSLAERLKYHLLRPMKLFEHHGNTMWRLLTGDPGSRAAWRTQRALQMWLRGEER